MNTSKLQNEISKIAHQTLNASILNGELQTETPDEIAASVAEALLKAYLAGFAEGQKEK